MEENIYIEDISSRRKKFIILGVIIFISLVILGIVYYHNNFTLHVKNKVTYEVGSKLSHNVKYYITSKIFDDSDYKLVFEDVIDENDILTTVGKYKYTIRYKGIKKKGIIEVIDTKAPEVEVQPLTIGLNENFNVDDFLTKCIDYSKPCDVTYKNKNDKNKNKAVGSYKFSIIISDSSKNKVEKEVNLIVKNNYNRRDLIKKDLTIDHIDDGFENWNGETIIKFKEAIPKEEFDSSEYFSEVFDFLEKDLHSYLPEDYYNNLITDTKLVYVYNKNNYVVAVTCYVKIDNGMEFYL